MWESKLITQALQTVVGPVLEAVSAKHLLALREDQIRRLPAMQQVLNQQSYLGPIAIIAIGKMADSLAWEFTRRFQLESPRGIVSAPYLTNAPQVAGLRYFRGGHPYPNEESLSAAKAALELVSSLGPDEPIFYLISGGGSACFELPDERLGLDDIQGVYRSLVTCGAEIRDINLIRSSLSKVKDGKLASACQSNHQLSLIVSDVPDDDLQFVSSGPTITSLRSVHPFSLVNKHALAKRMPSPALQIIQNVPETRIESKNPAAADFTCIGSNQDATGAAIRHFRELGWQVKEDQRFNESSTLEAAHGLLESLSNMDSGTPCCVVAGGEVRSKVTGPGQGGRNQAFVLECVPLIAGKNLAVMSFGTDGIDGNSPAAGAIADGDTLARALERQMDCRRFIAESNSHHFFSSLSSTLEMGPTQSNVRDVRILVKY